MRGAQTRGTSTHQTLPHATTFAPYSPACAFVSAPAAPTPRTCRRLVDRGLQRLEAAVRNEQIWPSSGKVTATFRYTVGVNKAEKDQVGQSECLWEPCFFHDKHTAHITARAELRTNTANADMVQHPTPLTAGHRVAPAPCRGAHVSQTSRGSAR